ncbi:GNAT family N-acetyltransferase [Agromyces sp. C10]|uniref:GNAT family N-acetyltransferase n=1 Tax=Agromyces sp. C10 TaxID=2935077 RepID=UPI00200A7ACE|nr:GNAT family N-acetyltransferase [Agromyces sp. C10]MCK8608852.1 GNAT family N-acetyltransferase [Agromyces sp. C10]
MTDPQPHATRIGIEPATSAADAELVESIADLVNRVYNEAEAGLWLPGAERTTPEQVAELVAAGQIATAREHDRLVGAVRVHALDDDLAEFGMLAADPDRRGLGIGRDLVAFSERLAAGRGARTMQLELLVPVSWAHPSKEFLRAWYERLGYRVVRTGDLAELHPELAPLLATECDLLVFHRPLASVR